MIKVWLNSRIIVSFHQFEVHCDSFFESIAFKINVGQVYYRNRLRRLQLQRNFQTVNRQLEFLPKRPQHSDVVVYFVAVVVVFEGSSVVLDAAFEIALFVGCVGELKGLLSEWPSVTVIRGVGVSVLNAPQRINAHILKQKIRKANLSQ
jgi:hypothetical protein